MRLLSSFAHQTTSEELGVPAGYPRVSGQTCPLGTVPSSPLPDLLSGRLETIHRSPVRSGPGSGVIGPTSQMVDQSTQVASGIFPGTTGLLCEAFHRCVFLRLGRSSRWSDRSGQLVCPGATSTHNVLETRAVRLSLLAFHVLCQSNILVATDNSTVVAYINNQGDTRSSPLWEE